MCFYVARHILCQVNHCSPSSVAAGVKLVVIRAVLGEHVARLYVAACVPIAELQILGWWNSRWWRILGFCSGLLHHRKVIPGSVCTILLPHPPYNYDIWNSRAGTYGRVTASQPLIAKSNASGGRHPDTNSSTVDINFIMVYQWSYIQWVRELVLVLVSVTCMAYYLYNL